MTINITADSIGDAASQLGLHDRPADIRITWRKGDPFGDWRPNAEFGCIVDATSVPGEEVKRCFKTEAEAARYLTALLKKHAAWVRDEKRKRAKEAKEAAKKKAASCGR